MRPQFFFTILLLGREVAALADGDSATQRTSEQVVMVQPGATERSAPLQWILEGSRFLANFEEAFPRQRARSVAITKDAAAALRMREYPTAYLLASQAIALNSANAQALNLRAIAASRMRRFKEAVADASAVLALDPENSTALQTRSWAFAKQNNYSEALRDAEDALSHDLSNPYAYQNKALALAGLKDRSGTLEALRRSAEIDARFQNRLERARQLPPGRALTALFDDEFGAQTAAFGPPTASERRRFPRLLLLSVLGGVLIAFAILHIAAAAAPPPPSSPSVHSSPKLKLGKTRKSP